MADWGTYTLGRVLAAGGNATVHSANAPDGTRVAIKIIKTKRPDSEPWKRFKSEINVLKQLAGTTGIMPILDAAETDGHLWYAMPLATPIREALRGVPLKEIVEFFLKIAETLDGLAKRRIYHRDIKPENLFRLQSGEPVIGDFGIHEGPANPEITPDGRRIGPALYAAQEMLDYKAEEDHTRADVFSLAKTFWVIATGQTLPLQGQHPSEFRGAWIANYRPETSTAPLDQLLIRATAVASRGRLTMGEFAAELRAWLSPQPQPAAAVDLSAIAVALVDPYRDISVKSIELGKVVGEIRAVVEAGAKLLIPLYESLRTIGGHANFSHSTNEGFISALTGFDVQRPIVQATYACLTSAFPPDGGFPILESGIGAYAVNGQVYLVAGHVLNIQTTAGLRRVPLTKTSEQIQLGSLMVPTVLAKLAKFLLDTVSDAAKEYATAVQGRTRRR